MKRSFPTLAATIAFALAGGFTAQASVATILYFEDFETLDQNPPQ
jgi:hypothetical protein